MPLSSPIFPRSFFRQYLGRKPSHEIVALQFVLRRVTFAAALLCACKPDAGKQTNPEVARVVNDSTVRFTPSTDSALPASPAEAVSPRYMDATIVTDTLINEPRIESRGSAWALRLPTAMARVLNDSLPGLMSHELVLGDFNGDSKVDVAIDGNTGNTSSFFILLSKSDSVPQPRLLFVWKQNTRVPDLNTYMGVVHPKEFPGDGEMTGPFTLRTDAVVYGYEMAASIYFVDKGAISSYSIAD